MNFQPTQLSLQAFNELKAIVRDEIPGSLTDDGIEEMGIRLLQLFALITREDSNQKKITVSDHDYKALKFLSNETQAGRNPSVRDLSRVMGFRSSRSGFRLLKKYLANRWVERDGKGRLRMVDR